MSKLINIVLRPISEPYSESSLMHKEADDTASIAFYMENLFSGYSDFKSQFAFLWDQFFPQIEWVRLTLSF